MRRWRILGMVVLTVAMVSCIAAVEPDHIGYVVDGPPYGHVCSDNCGHYWHDSRMYYAQGHVHGPNCGHVYAEGRWRCNHR